MATMQQAFRLASIEPPRPPIRTVLPPVPSTVSNLSYEEISLGTLVRLSREAIQSFREYLQGIPFRFNDLIPTVLGRHLDTEGDVRLFFDSSIVLAVWPVALAMPPTIRAADLVLTSEKRHDSSRPDMSVLAYSGPAAGQPTAVAQIEIKGPRGLAAFRPVIQSVLDGRVIAQPVDWTAVTRQLRKYAQDTHCRSVLCSDGFDAYVFIFPPDESVQTVYFIWSWSDSASSPLTLREAVLFSIWCGIKLNTPFELRYVYTHLR
jgi:hypothetical protein